MLLTVKEVCYILDIKRRQLYYILDFSQCDGAFKIFNTWRIDENYLGGIYDRLCNSSGDKLSSSNTGLTGFKERTEAVKKNFLSSCERREASCVQGRKTVVCSEKRPVGVARKPRQLELWENGNYWY